MASGTKSRHLEMKYVPREVCYEVRVRADVAVQLAQFPEEEAILKLWNDITGCRLDYLRQAPSKPFARFFLIAPDESTQPSHRRYFLKKLDEACVFATSSFSMHDLERAQRTLSQGPLYLVRYRIGDMTKEEFVTAERAAGILDLEFSDRVLLSSVVELMGASIMRRDITVEERKRIASLIQEMG